MKRIITLFLVVFSIYNLSAQSPIVWKANHVKVDHCQVELIIKASVKTDWYIYSQKADIDFPTRFTFEDSNGFVSLTPFQEEGTLISGYDKLLERNIKKYAKSVTFRKVIQMKEAYKEVKLEVEYMSCSDKECTPPTTQNFVFPISMPTYKGLRLASGINQSKIPKSNKKADPIRKAADKSAKRPKELTNAQRAVPTLEENKAENMLLAGNAANLWEDEEEEEEETNVKPKPRKEVVKKKTTFKTFVKPKAKPKTTALNVKKETSSPKKGYTFRPPVTKVATTTTASEKTLKKETVKTEDPPLRLRASAPDPSLMPPKKTKQPTKEVKTNTTPVYKPQQETVINTTPVAKTTTVVPTSEPTTAKVEKQVVVEKKEVKEVVEQKEDKVVVKEELKNTETLATTDVEEPTTEETTTSTVDTNTEELANNEISTDLLAARVKMIPSKKKEKKSPFYDPIKWKYSTNKISEQVYELVVEADIESNWFIYAANNLNTGSGPFPIDFRFDENDGIHFLEDGMREEGTLVSDHDANFDKETNRYAEKVVFKRKVRIEKDVQVTGNITFMVCNADSYLMPKEVKFLFNEQGGKNVLIPNKNVAGTWWVLGLIVSLVFGLGYMLHIYGNPSLQQTVQGEDNMNS